MAGPNWANEALTDARPTVFWSDRPDAPSMSPSLTGPAHADLTVVGGGFTGLWAAIQALEEQPELTVIVLEAEQCGFGASSRNGGFASSSLTHGLENGINHWPHEADTLVRLGRENLDGIDASIDRYGIVADYHRAAQIDVATEPWHLASLETSQASHARYGFDVELLDGDAMRSRVNSPTYLGGLLQRSDMALVDPARLCWELRRTAESLGATIFERSPARDISLNGSSLIVTTPNGTVRSGRVLMATNAYPGPARGARRYVIPVYDHVLMTEPLNTDQMSSIAWLKREGVSDASNQFHYYRLTDDNRILWGGWDATYHFNNGLKPPYDQSEETHAMLAEHFFDTFPQLEGLRFTHRWGGPIATTTQFTATWGTTHEGRMTWVAGYTGLGVAASRFGARVALDLAFGQHTERTELEMVHKKPFPFPPEPLRWAGVQVTRKAIQRSDRRQGKRGPWLALLDRFGVGFDS